MALLTIVDAVRVTGVSRSQLYRYLRSGKLSRTPDGLLDTAELLRAGLSLSCAIYAILCVIACARGTRCDRCGRVICARACATCAIGGHGHIRASRRGSPT